MDATKWFHIVGLISACSLGIGFVAAFISVTLSWKINNEQQEKMTKLQIELTKAEERVEILRRQIPPPRIPKEFSDALKGVSPGIAYIRYKEGDVAGLEFVNELSNVLKNNGWGPRNPEVADPQMLTNMDFRFLDDEDVILKGRQLLGPTEKNPALFGLENAFIKGGFKVTLRFDDKFGIQDILIIVAPKPGGPRTWRPIN